MRRKRNEFGASPRDHRDRFDAAYNDLLLSLEEEESAATCRRRFDALARAHGRWGEMVTEFIDSSESWGSVRAQEKSDAAVDMDAHDVDFVRDCLRTRGS